MKLLKEKIRPFYYLICKGVFSFLILLSDWIWRNIQSEKLFFVKKTWNVLLSLFRLGVYTIHSSKSYTLENSECTYRILQNNRVGKSVGLIYELDEKPVIKEIPLRDLYVASFKNVEICGGSDCIIDKESGSIISDYSYFCNTNLYENDRVVIRIQKNRVALLKVKKNVETQIDRGILLCAPFTNNYYHSIYDALFKLYYIEKEKIAEECPLLVDDSFRDIAQLNEVLNILNRSGRQIIWIKRKTWYKVKELFYIPSLNQMPLQVKKSDFICGTDFVYDDFLMAEYTRLLLSHKSGNIYPPKVYLSRSGFSRRKYNEKELIAIAEKHGFKIVHPECLPFREQMALFNGAKIIVGATGAAFTNIMFCQAGASSICFMGKRYDLPIFTIGSYVSKSDLIYHIGTNTSLDPAMHDIQSNFYIQPSKFENLIKQMEKE